MKFQNTNFILKKNSKIFINFLYIACITVLIMGFLVNCGGASIDCSDSTVKETVVKIIKERFEEEEVDTSDVKIKLSDIETISKDENSCECVAIIHITVEDESLPFPITYDANKTGKSGQILVSVSAFDL